MAQKSLAMTFLFGPPYDIITWAGHTYKSVTFLDYKSN